MDQPAASRRTAIRFLAGGGLALAGLAAGRGACDAGQVVDVGKVVLNPGGGSGGVPPAIHVFYSETYTLSGYSFETTRKARWVAAALARDPVPGLALVAPTPLEEASLLATHNPRYVAAVRTGEPRALAESQGFVWDAGLWPMVLASNGGAVAAALGALRAGVAGSLSSGLHHAARGGGKGFCTFNGLALAARAALSAGARRVLVLDLDAHCSGGSHALLGDDPAVWQTDVSVNSFDSYAPGPRATLDLVRGAGDYLPTIERRLGELGAQRPDFDLCLYNAGMDPHEDCPVGGLAGIGGDTLAARERLVFDWCRRQRLPVAFVLAGGYTGPRLDAHGVAGLHRLTLAAAAGAAT